ncbi:hypothetical protein BEP19_14220 [Ammoniphilus oxalaticus]|uniref:Carboxyltransferase domain-containing protein n=1 Tax=Ammoniphilus oxalaticus TaxID=66863 RepID=A0A419SEN6_9BACL|nr:biotin-dependent carboxyltransferase family protein [Ammoniphilus oxalaticus]RKD21773.1 hypothetical protein BEP19_14220 [Ammoniphilus oxalaticus]
MSLKVIDGGLLTTVQDLGRVGYQKYGVIVSGAMDSIAFSIANLLVGNRENEAALEITMLGPTLQFQKDHLIAICGANLQPTINQRSVPLWRPVWVKKGSILQFGQPKLGCRAYLAVGGGLALRETLGSRSTYLRAALGGFEGRSLQKGDCLQVKPRITNYDEVDWVGVKQFETVNWAIAYEQFMAYQSKPLIRIIRGPQFESFTEESQRQFFLQSFQINPQSDRMGYRLSGANLKLKSPLEMLSEPVTNGTIQVPPSGEPILLLADRQTVGGYPKIGYVITVDLPIVAQLKPGDHIYFREVSLEEAQRCWLERGRSMKILKLMIPRLLAGGTERVG